MKEENEVSQAPAVLGQKYAFATISLILGICCFVNLLGLEKAILAIVFGLMALKAAPLPRLQQRRVWAKAGVALGAVPLIFLPLLIIIKFDELKEIIQTLQHLSNTR
jgi:hypothetical protein